MFRMSWMSLIQTPGWIWVKYNIHSFCESTGSINKFNKLELSDAFT